MPDYQGKYFQLWLEKNHISVDKAREKLRAKNRQTVYQYFKSKKLNADSINKILHSFGVNESDIWPNESNELNEPNHNISREKENLSRNLKDDPMQSRELIEMQKKVIELLEKVAILEEKLRNAQGHTQPEKSVKAKPSASSGI